MEVLHRNAQLYGSNPTAMFPPTVHRMYVSPSDVYSCYSFETNTPSRTPTPERPMRSQDKQGSNVELSSHATTLQSVLRGEIPPAYSHLASTSLASTSLQLSATPSSALTTSTPSESSLSSSLSSHAMELDSVSQPLLHHAPSPCPSHHSSLSYSPRPQSHESHASQDSNSEMQTEPMDLSCKKPSENSSRKRTAVSAFLDVATGSSSNGLLSSSLPAKFGSSSREFLSSSPSFPTSSSPSVTSMHSFPPSPGDGQHGEEFSLLRNLLSVGKHHLTSPGVSGLSSSTPNLSSDRGCDSPASDSFPRVPITGNTRVTLAKKNLLPVSARVSDWLVKIVQFAKSIPEFSSLSHNDKVTLILNSWSRLMLLYMAESTFQFAVTPLQTSADVTSADTNPSQDEPTMKSVEGVQTFIKKCQQIAVDSKEYEFLRMLVLFNAGYVGLSCPDTIDQLNSVVQQLLQQHVRVTRPSDVMHYSRLLMSLPSLYGINSKMLETIFCKHISKKTDMEVLLKELLQNLS